MAKRHALNNGLFIVDITYNTDCYDIAVSSIIGYNLPRFIGVSKDSDIRNLMSNDSLTHPDVRGIPQMWYRPSNDGKTQSPASRIYRPAALIECRLSFRSIRASFQHTEEKYFTAWYPSKHVTIDWASPAVDIQKADDLGGIALAEAKYKSGEYDFSSNYFDDLEEELIEHLVRTVRYSVLYNSHFGLYSEPMEDRKNFLARVGESGLEKVEPEIKRLLGRFELAIEQLREAQLRRGRKLEGDKAEEAFAYWREVFSKMEKGLADMFVGKFQMVLEIPLSRIIEDNNVDDQELIDEVRRIERDAKDAINTLYTDYLEMVNQCDDFEVGLQRENVHVLRRSLLWVLS